METSLIIPKAITKKVQPKPTKAELVEALAQRKLRLWYEQREKDKAEYKKLENELNEALRGFAHKNAGALIAIAQVSHGNFYASRWYNVRVTLELDNPPDGLFKKRKDLEAHPGGKYRREPTITEIRKEIRNQLAGITPTPDRVSAMLTDSGMQKALDKMLADLDRETQKALGKPEAEAAIPV